MHINNASRIKEERKIDFLSTFVLTTIKITGYKNLNSYQLKVVNKKDGKNVC